MFIHDQINEKVKAEYTDAAMEAMAAYDAEDMSGADWRDAWITFGAA